MMASDSAGRLNAAARRFGRGTTNENSLNKRIGPSYDTKAVAARLSVSCSTVYRRIARREILGLPTSDHHYLFPIWQFDEAAMPLSGLSEVLKAMDPYLTDPWGDALWLSTGASLLEGKRPIDQMKCGKLETVLEIAVRIGAATAEA